MDPAQIAQMGDAGGDCELTGSLGSQAMATTEQAFLLERASRPAVACSLFVL
jgi:hypothetical protein